MIELRTGTRIWIAAGVTDMRRGFQGLSAQVQTALQQQPATSGSIHIEFPRRATISVECGADPVLLRLILESLPK